MEQCVKLGRIKLGIAPISHEITLIKLDYKLDITPMTLGITSIKVGKTPIKLDIDSIKLDMTRIKLGSA